MPGKENFEFTFHSARTSKRNLKSIPGFLMPTPANFICWATENISSGTSYRQLNCNNLSDKNLIVEGIIKSVFYIPGDVSNLVHLSFHKW